MRAVTVIEFLRSSVIALKKNLKPEKFKAVIKNAADWLFDHGFDDGFRDKDLRGPVALLAGALLSGFYWMGASSSKVSVAREGMAGLEMRVKLIAEYRQLSSSWDEVGSSAFLDPDLDAQEWLQSKLPGLAREFNVEVLSFNSGQPIESGAVRLSQGTFDLRGGYHDIGRFLAKLESHRPFIGIGNLTLAKERTIAEQGGVKATVQLGAYVLSQVQALAAGKT